MAKKKTADATKSTLVPTHTKLNEKETKKVLEKYHITVKELPRILKDDPAILHLDAQAGDVIKVSRTSAIIGEAIYYRGVVNE